MSSEALLDNDVMSKTACYSVVNELVELIGKVGGVPAALGVSRFVVSKKLTKSKHVSDKDAAIKSLEKLLAATTLLEPSNNETNLAAELEEVAQRLNVGLDSGESQLLAILIIRNAKLMLTGDKRAIGAIEIVAKVLEIVQSAHGRIACLEQLILALLNRIDPIGMQALVCKEALIDKALAICFSCVSNNFRIQNTLSCLNSYVGDLRKNAPAILAPDDIL